MIESAGKHPPFWLECFAAAVAVAVRELDWRQVLYSGKWGVGPIHVEGREMTEGHVECV